MDMTALHQQLVEVGAGYNSEPPPNTDELRQLLNAHWDNASDMGQIGFELNVCGPNHPFYVDVHILAHPEL